MHLPPPDTVTAPPPAHALVTTRRDGYAAWARPVFRAPDLRHLDLLTTTRREPAFARPRFRPSQRRR
jgi:hypothetical protein